MDEHPGGMNQRESRMLRNGHVRFGGRAGETHQLQSRQGAPVRPLHLSDPYT
jgi:hypothetical protein